MRPALTGDQRAALPLLTSPSMRARVRDWIERLGVQSRDVDDLTQDVITAAIDSLHTYDPAIASIERWLNRITVHVCAKYNDRARHRYEELAPEPLGREDQAPTAEELLQAEDDRLLVLEALQFVPFDLRAVVVAHELDAIPMKEVAERFRTPVSTAYKWRARGLAALADALRKLRG